MKARFADSTIHIDLPALLCYHFPGNLSQDAQHHYQGGYCL